MSLDPPHRDPLYRPSTELPGNAAAHEFAGVPCGVLVTDTDPASVEAQYLPDRSINLIVTESVTADQLDRMLPPFLAHAAGLVDRPSLASVALPARAVELGRVARSHSLYPAGVLAVADLRRGGAAGVTGPVPGPGGGGPAGDGLEMRGGAAVPGGGGPAGDGLTVRSATLADAAAVADLWCEQSRYETLLGALRLTPEIEAAIRAAVPVAVGDGTQLLVAERDGAIVGLIVGEPPAMAEWAADRCALRPAGYLAVGATSAAARGRGVGSALVAEWHRRLRAGGAAAGLLHYSPWNPLSVPFWSASGYRPLVVGHTRPLRAD